MLFQMVTQRPLIAWFRNRSLAHPFRQGVSEAVIGLQEGARTGGDMRHAGQVAVAHGAGEIVIFPGAAVRAVDVAGEAAIEAIRRRGWRGHADQRVQVVQILAGQFQFQVEIAQPQRVQQRAAGMRTGRSTHRFHVDTVGLLGVLQFQRRFGGAVQGEVVAFLAALAGYGHAGQRIALAGLAAQEISLQEAAICGVYLHGLAAELTGIDIGLAAGELSALLPQAREQVLYGAEAE